MRRAFLQTLVVLPALLVGGCTAEPTPLLRVGTNVWVGYEPLYLARALGHYDPHRIRLVEHTSASGVMRAFLDGELEAVAVTLDEALTLLSQGLALKVVLVFDASAGADALVAHPHIRTLSDLRGKRIGMESGAVGAVMMAAVLEQSGLALDEVVRVPITAGEQVSSYRSGQVDAVIAFEPHVSRLRSLGGRVLMDSRSIPNRILDVLAVRADVLPGQAANVRLLLNGYLAALFHQRNNPNDAYKRMAPRLGADVAGQLAGIHQPDLAENHALLAGLDGQAQTYADFLRANQLLQHRVVVRGLADGRYLPTL